MLFAEGLDEGLRAPSTVSAKPTRRAVRAWGLEILCPDPAEYSAALTAVLMPDGHNADAFRRDRPRSLRHVARHRASARSRARCSASATSAGSTTSCCAARSPASRWAWACPACRIGAAVCRRRSTISPARRRMRSRPPRDRSSPSRAPRSAATIHRHSGGTRMRPAPCARARACPRRLAAAARVRLSHAPAFAQIEIKLGHVGEPGLAVPEERGRIRAPRQRQARAARPR